MIIDWFLDSRTQLCKWKVQTQDCTFEFSQSVESFFMLVGNLHEAVEKLKALMANGMDPKAAIEEWERMLRENQGHMASPQEGNCYLINQDGQVVGETDKVYDLTSDTITFAEVIQKGNLKGVLRYNGWQLEIISVEQQIGLLVDDKGSRGPVLKGVCCKIFN